MSSHPLPPQVIRHLQSQRCAAHGPRGRSLNHLALATTVGGQQRWARYSHSGLRPSASAHGPASTPRRRAQLWRSSARSCAGSVAPARFRCNCFKSGNELRQPASTVAPVQLGPPHAHVIIPAGRFVRAVFWFGCLRVCSFDKRSALCCAVPLRRVPPLVVEPRVLCFACCASLCSFPAPGQCRCPARTHRAGQAGRDALSLL